MNETVSLSRPKSLLAMYKPTRSSRCNFLVDPCMLELWLLVRMCMVMFIFDLKLGALIPFRIVVSYRLC